MNCSQGLGLAIKQRAGYGQFDGTLFPNADWRECVLESLQSKQLRRWAPDRIDQDDDSLIEQIHRWLLPARGI